MLRFVELNDNYKYFVGEKIRIRREELGLSQDQLADTLGTNRQMVSRYENGEREMGIVRLLQYAEALETDPASLLPSYDEEPSSKISELTGLIKGLADEDMDILIAMAARMKR